LLRGSLFLAVAPCVFISLFVAQKLLRFGTLRFKDARPSKILWTLLYASLAISLPEEIIFRGFIQTALRHAANDILLVVIASSIVFGAAHLSNKARGWKLSMWNWKLAAMAFVLGIYLGFVYDMTGSLVIPTILHSIILICFITFLEED